MPKTITDLKAAAARHSTHTLLGGMRLLDAKATLTEPERMTYTAIADVITERYGLDDALDEVFEDEVFAGTYTDALVIALAKADVR